MIIKETEGGKVLLQLNTITTKKICPFVQDPSGDCYCFKLGSQDIEKAVHYCNKNFETCDIYKIKFIATNGDPIGN
jgi:hypothetical protein